MRSYRPWLLGLLAFALGLRLVAAVFFSGGATSGPDAADYWQLAGSLADGRGFSNPDGSPEFFRPPIYPAFLAFFVRLFGPSPLPALIAQAFLDTATVAIIAFWTRARLGEAAGLAALALGAISLTLLAGVRLALSETLATFFLAASIVLFDHLCTPRDEAGGRRSNTAGLWLVLGVCMGLMTLTRGIVALLPFVMFALWFLYRRHDVKSGVANARGAARWGGVLMIGAYLLTLAPWIARNHGLTGRPMLSNQAGSNLYLFHRAYPNTPYGTNVRNEITRRGALLPPEKQDAYYIAEAKKSLRADPMAAVKFMPKKIAFFFVPFDWEMLGRTRTFNATYALTALLAIIGFWRLRRSHPRFAWHCLLPGVYLLAMAFVFFGSPRYRAPCEVLLLPLAAAPLAAWLSTRATRTEQAAQTATPAVR
jgi:hypothetical protein